MADTDDGGPRELECGMEADGWIAGYCWLYFAIIDGNGWETCMMMGENEWMKLLCIRFYLR